MNINQSINQKSGYDSKKSLSQQTRDFIGENLIDIENTLKALNLDFLQTFNELEKNDSAETLFGENYAYESNMNPKILNTALKLAKFPPNYGNNNPDASPKSIRSSQFSPLDKQMAQQTFNGLQYLNDGCSNEKLLDGKRSSTPDTGFASRETTNSSRRGSQKSSYSPQDSHFSPIDFTYSQQSQMSGDSRSPYAIGGMKGTFPSRQRSMSFTENYDLKSPVLSEPQVAKMRNSTGADGLTVNGTMGQSAILRNRNRNSISYKPKSIRARNLRRLSYNPIALESSSSSSSEPEFDNSIAHSECDIRTKMYSSTRQRNSLKRKSQNFHSNPFVRGPDKLYGSNASIKSAPQYNNYASEQQLNNYLDQKFGTGTATVQYEIDAEMYQEFIRNERRSFNRGSRRGQVKNLVVPPAPPPPTANSVHQQPRVFDFGPQVAHINLYAQFDVSKLTGKSPTTHSFLQDGFPPELNNGQGVTVKSPVGSAAAKKSGASVFQWPEKIHASAVKQNDLLWRQSVQQSPRSKKLSSSSQSMGPQYNSDSSNTETNFTQRRPPSPAP